MKTKNQFVSLLLVLGMILGCTLTGTDSLAASYGDSLNLSGQQIELNGTTTYNCIGHMYHRSKKVNGKVQGLFPKTIKIKAKFTVKCSLEEDSDDENNYLATFDIITHFPTNPKIKMKKLTAISEDAVGNTLTPMTFTTVFDYETGENLEFDGEGFVQDADGGAVKVASGSVALSKVSIHDFSTMERGAAVYVDDNADLTLSDGFVSVMPTPRGKSLMAIFSPSLKRKVSPSEYSPVVTLPSASYRLYA